MNKRTTLVHLYSRLPLPDLEMRVQDLPHLVLNPRIVADELQQRLGPLPVE